MKKIIAFIQHEMILCIGILCALISMIFVPFSVEYMEYIDFRVLSLLFCLMIVIAGMQDCDLFNIITEKLLSGKKQLRTIAILLVLLPFFTSMFITNDVALLTFVPFTLVILKLANAEKYAIRLIILQTIAANLGSMATPAGNPQNLFLFEAYHLTTSQFFSTIIPYVIISFLLLTLTATSLPKTRIEVAFETPIQIQNIGQLIAYIVLFLLCILSIFRLLPYPILLAIIIVSVLLINKMLLLRVDYSLLLLFVSFFIFAGNLGRLPFLQEVLTICTENNTMLTSLFISQVISNVPAAVLLSNFTTDWKNLLIGVNLGGLGTPIASLASLISIKIYSRCDYAKIGAYLLKFIFFNIITLIILLVFYKLQFNI
ncbi:MAG: SLC13 family permease [Lachnospiraceae bacterium]